ncbi:RAF1 [Scenedesmus sp. PABB004]|nr:RAF1 [Scenedesmus sp. PABB004]
MLQLPAQAAPCAARGPARRARVAAGATSGRGGYGDSGLILGPNSGNTGPPGGAAGRPRGLILPGGSGQFGASPGRPRPGIGLSEDGPGGAGGGAVPNKYRPPPGFMNADAQDPAASALDPQEMLSKLRAGAGHWHALAKFLPVLYAKGLDTNAVAELTGINPVDQNRWVVAGTVYDSIAATGQVPEPVLRFFDAGGDELLYHFRFLAAERRAAAAQYVVANGLDDQQSEVLARAMKEWDRRPGERAGFSESPGDCMAFKFLRDAVECRFPEDAAERVQLALAAADTDGARARLEEWQASELAQRAEAAAAPLASRAVLMVLRLSQDELGFRPLPQVSPLQSLGAEELLAAPGTTQEGAFGAFNMPATDRGQKWVALPQWKALALARHPVAIPLADCAAEPSVLAASRAKSEEEKKRLTGAGLLVVDTAPPPGPLDPAGFYLVAAPPGGGGGGPSLALVEGARLLAEPGGGGAPVAAALFLCRPPNRESSITSAELLQL